MPSPDEFASLLAGRRRYPIDDPVAGYSAPNDPAEPGVAPYMAATPQFRPAPRTGQSIQEILDQIRQRQQEFHAPAPTVPEQIGDILAKTGQVAKDVATAPVNAVANLYGRVAEEHSGSPSLSSDDYRDPNAMAHDPEVLATALGLMGAGVPFAKPGALGAAGGRLVVPAAERNLSNDISNFVKESSVKNRVYHGSPAPFDQFAVENGRQFFSDDPKVASRFAETGAQHYGEGSAANVRPAYLNIKKPYIIDAQGDFAGNYQFGPKGDEYRRALEDPQYDGIVFKNTKDEGNVYVVKTPQQIKHGALTSPEVGQGPFYSAVEQAVGNAKLAKAPMDQWYNFLKGQPGVKAEELVQLGITPGNTGVPLTREQMLGHVNANQVHLNEVGKGEGLGETKYSQYQLPGGSNYQEKLLTLPEYKENGFQSDHWDEPNVLLHVRHNDRMVASPNGVGELPSLHLEELQSDWHQIGRKDGYQQPGKVSVFKQVEAARDKYKEDPTADNKSAYDKILNQWLSGEEPPVPKVPFKASWPDLALKRMLHKAATDVNPDGTPKYHALSWTPGDAQNARYPREDAEANVGMKKFYDEMLVSKANALGKKYGTKVGRSPDHGLHTLLITPDLRAAAAKGFPLFATGAVAGPAISQGLDDRAAKALATKPPDL